ncbi:integrase [Pseudomonas phage PA_LZ03]|nr:integrase [Pseudomonas phage PA_LZ03]
MLQPNTQESVEFLQRLYAEGPWALTGISPDKKTIKTATFWPGGEMKLAAWLGENVGKLNIYFHVNRPMGDLRKKAEKTDIEAMHYLHVDIDPRAGEDIEEERKRALDILRSANPAPTIIIDSGGGFQAFWKLEEPLPIHGDLAAAEAAERYNIHLERLYGADNCHNVDRIMRLPGTINLPDAKKLKKGRKEALASLVEFNDNVYPISAFTAAPKVQSEETLGFSGKTVLVSGNVERLESVDDLNQWEVPDWLKVLIVQGNDPDNPTKFPSRSEALFACTCELVRRGVPDDVIFSILTDESFGIAESVVEHKRPEKYALRQIERAHEDAIDPMLRELNEKHAVIGDMGGKCRIISEVWDHAMKRHKISRQSFEDFRNRYRHIKVKVGDDGKGNPMFKPAGAWWVDHPNRRQYETVVFAPCHEVPDAYNLWKGFAVDAIAGDKHLPYLQHLRDNVCSGDEELYNYFVGWMARAVQHPDSPGEVAIVLRGKMGTGKSFLVKCFGNLFGRHFMQVSDPKHLVGSFNAHLRDCVVLFGDEAFYAGDKKHESILKTLITEEVIIVEGKGVDAEAAPNYVHLLMASNSEWVVPAGPEERRYLVIDVSADRMQDRDYFRELKKSMDEGGSENLLHFLMTYDLSNFEVRAVPKTKALQDQKLLSLSPEQQWWYEKLHFGRMFGDDTEWVQEVQVKELQEDYLEFMHKVGSYRKLSNVALGKFLQKVCPPHFPESFQKRAELVTYTPDGFAIKKMGRPYFYRFPDLKTLRDIWDANFGGPYPWQDVSSHREEAEDEKKDPF